MKPPDLGRYPYALSGAHEIIMASGLSHKGFVRDG
jgi:hypothetical protein